MPDLSIIMLVHNKINFTLAALKDLSHLDENKIEIIIVDNNSSDSTYEEISKIKRKNFNYIKNNTNLFFSKGCNIGYKQANSNNILFLNNDIRIKSKEDWTIKLIEEINNNPNTLIGPTGGLIDEKNNFNFVYETQDKNKKINYISGWCIAADKNTFNKLEENNEVPFSSSLNFYYSDSDLCFRAKKLGINMKIIDLPIIHFGKISSAQLNIPILYTQARNDFIKKWRNK